MPEITEDRFPWPPASATGVGSLPGTDPVEALRLVFGELPDLPHLAELPAGAGRRADRAHRRAARRPARGAHFYRLAVHRQAGP